LVEVTTDKIVADIPSPLKGRVAKINYEINQSCLVGNILCEIVEDEVTTNASKGPANESISEKSKINSETEEESEYHDIVASAVSKSKCKIIIHYKSFSHSQC
jgi:pyruvate/2-oxoglutarate dehydrogenase complex dihydrolipoamide acyltransferase (E2) component